jgi:hypothetical protein
MHDLGPTYAKNYSFFYLKFKFKWVLCLLAFMSEFWCLNQLSSIMTESLKLGNLYKENKFTFHSSGR